MPIRTQDCRVKSGNDGFAIEANLHNMSVRQTQLVFTSRKLVTALYKSPHCWSLRLRSVTELICSSEVPSIIIVLRAEPLNGAGKKRGFRGLFASDQSMNRVCLAKSVAFVSQNRQPVFINPKRFPCRARE